MKNEDSVDDYETDKSLSFSLHDRLTIPNKLQPGKLYELALFIYTLINNNKKKFDLGKEIKFGDKWDDLVVKQRDNNYNHYTFLQIKLIDDSNNRNNFIDSKVLLGKRRISLKEDDFKMQKYFISYLRIKDQLNSRNDKSKIKKLIIFSNAQLDISELNNNIGDILCLKVTSENDIVPNTNKSSKDNNYIAYKVTKVRNTFVREMKVNLKSDSVKLAEELAVYVVYRNSETMSLDKDHLAYYHTSLMDENIIEVTTQQQGKRTIKRSKFTKNFQYGLNLSHRAQNIRNKLINILKNKKLNSQELQKLIELAEWTVSEDFNIRQTEDFIFLPNYDINDKDIFEYFSVLEIRAKQFDVKAILGMIMNVEIKKIFLEYYDTDPKLVEFLISDFINSWKNKTPVQEMWILNEERSKFIQKLKIKISKPKAIHKTQERVKYLEEICTKYKLYYDNSCLFEKKHFDHTFVVIKTKSNLLTSIKIIQSLNRMNQRSIIFIDLDNLIQKKEFIKLLDAFQSNDFRIMVISYTYTAINNSLCSDIFIQLSMITRQNSEKTIIFVSSVNDDPLIKKYKLLKGYKEYDDKLLGFQYLKSASRLLDLHIFVQNQRLKLSDILDEFQTNYNLFNEKVLEDLICDREIRVGSKPNGTSDLEGAYSDIEEVVNLYTLTHKVSQNSSDIYLINGLTGSNQEETFIKVLKAGIKDISKKINFRQILSNIEIMKQDDFMKPINKLIRIVSFDLTKEIFKRICHNNSQRKIYWLTFQNNDVAPQFLLEKIYNPDFYLAAQRFNDETIIKRNIKTLLVSSNIDDSFIIIVKNENDFENWLQLVDYEEIRNFKQNCKSKKVRYVLCKAIAEAIFQEIIEYTSHAIHLLEFHQNCLIWCKTHGLISKLIKFKEKNYKYTKPLLGENTLIEEIKDKKNVVFVGEPGIGKSTALIRLCELKEALNSNMNESIIESHWLFVVKLKDHLQAIKSIDNDKNDEEMIIKEVTKFLLQVEKNLSSEFAKKLLSFAITKNDFKKPVLILFDGFDEIVDKINQKKIIFLLQGIKDKTKAKFWITSRRHCEYILENAASNFSIKIEKMYDNQISEYVNKYLRNRLYLSIDSDKFENLFDNGDENMKMREFTNAFTSAVQKVFLGDISKFIGTPLQLFLMLGILATHFRKFIDDDGCHIPDFSCLGTDIWAVYEKFIESKYDIYFTKTNVMEQLKREQDQVIFDRYHRSLAKSLMFNSIVKEDLEYFKNILLMVGIVQLHGSDMEFIHLTFKEYFVAKEVILWIDKWNKRLNHHFTNFNKQEYLLGEVLLKPEFKTVRIFLNVKLLKEKFENLRLQEIYYNKDILDVAVRERHIGIMTLVLNNVEKVNINSFSVTPILHVAVEYGDLNIIKFLIDNNIDINCKDNFNFDESVLHKAAKFGNINLVKVLMKYGVDVNATDKNGISVLYRAVQSKNLELVEFLITNGAFVNAKDKYGRSVLCGAVNTNNLIITKHLIAKGAHIDADNDNDSPVLDIAIMSSNLEMVEVLVANGANVHFRDKLNNSLLHTAAAYDKLDIVKFLISKHVDINAKNKYEKSVLHCAADSANLDMVKFLALNGAIVTAKDSNNKSVLHNAARSDNVEIVKFLVANGADVNANDKKNNYVLHEAAETGNLEMVKFLISLGVNIHVKNDMLKSVLHSAARSGNFKLVKFLVDKGLCVNEKDFYRTSVLHIAAEIKSFAMVKFLVQKGANINARKSNGESVLHNAAKFNVLDILILIGKKHFRIDPKVNLYECYMHDATKIVEFLAFYGADVHTKDNRGRSALQNAAEFNNFDLVKLLITSGANVNSKDNNNKSVLLSAVETSSLEMVKFLIDSGSDINSKDKEGKSALHKAAESKNLDLIKYLVKSGADVNVHDKGGKSILHNGSLSFDIVKFLIEVGADITAKDIDNRSVLHYAVESCNLDIVKLLIQAGANINVKDKNGIAILHNAIETRCLVMVKYLTRSGADVNALDNNDKSVLHFACESGDLEIVDFLIRRNANVYAKTKNNTTIFYYAVKSSNLELVQYLYRNGIEIDVKVENDKPILHVAAESGNLEMVKFLISNGVCVNIRDSDYRTVLHSVAKNFDFALLKFLVNSGLDINAEDKDKKTILHYAIFSSDLDLVRFIVESGADVNVIDKDKKSILYYAVETSNSALVKLIVLAGGDVNALDKDHKSVLHNAAKFSCFDIVEFLVMSNADINAKDLSNKSVLHYAVESDNLQMVEFLVAKGLDINLKDINGKSVLQTAFEVHSSSTLLEYIITKGADIHSYDNNGVTVLQSAASSGNLEMVKFLIANGGDSKAKDNNGKTVLQYAEEYGDLDLIKFIVGDGGWQSWLHSSC